MIALYITAGVILGWISIDLLLIFKIRTPQLYNFGMSFVGGLAAYHMFSPGVC